jgi:thiol-disulfide isomerase/thioredoxin
MTSGLRVLLVAGLVAVGGCLTGCSSSAIAAKPGTCLAPVSATSNAEPAASATPDPVASGSGAAGSAVSGSAASDSSVPGSGSSGSAASGASGKTGQLLPRTALGCLDGSGDVSLAAIERPMIVSFWATYCQPCQAELPIVESFAKAAGGSIAVVGVDSGDERSKALSFASDLGLTFPMVFDPTTGLLKAVAPPELPRLLFVTAGGRLAYSYASNQLTAATLRQLAATYLGVRVR